MGVDDHYDKLDNLCLSYWNARFGAGNLLDTCHPNSALFNFNVVRWFKSCSAARFQNAVVVELVRHAGLKILHEDTLWVRIPPAVPNFKCVCDSTVECQTSSFLHFKGCFVFQSERVYPLIIPWWDSSLVWWTTIQRGSRLVVLAPFL